ncbi:MAG: helix-turn-helix transcriptional regulator [Clostridia bacterium]|nr:helix-turn-helix transcriptional regulator [Clostridia bacterium]
MEELKTNIARNIMALRKSWGMTQAELAQRLNYTDKAVSKWERAESVPDVATLKTVADTFGVTVDDLLRDAIDDTPFAPFSEAAELPDAESADKRANRIVVALIAVSVVWLVATVVFVVMKLFPNDFDWGWVVYVYAFPVSCLVLLLFNMLWGKRLLNFVILSLLTWSILFAVYISMLWLDLRSIFLLGIPAQIIIILWACLRPVGKKREKRPQ